MLNILVGNLLYWICAIVAAVFVAGAVVVLVAGLSESPLMASGFATAISLLSFGFGWSGRHLLNG